jgi:dTDP-4-dehydrorhamnose reductase
MERIRGRSAPLEMWGGIECTHNRVGNDYFDQIRWTGHDAHPEDLDRIAELGISTLRYPVLWEWADAGGSSALNWSWPDERLPILNRLGIKPIVGLTHHGSGPRTTNLLDERFAENLASFAGRVADRYPWLDTYTPVNEPLTTSRFSALYGHWYPHEHNPLAFARAFLNQCRAVVLSMKAVRQIRPDAKLVQTEDLGHTQSTEALAYQADFENERRWLTFDLLCGRVDRHHPIGAYFVWLGIEEADLLWFQNHPCPPSLIGINYYVTSERFLDHRLERYSHLCPGGNGRHVYADLEAVRVADIKMAGPLRLIREVWRRYRLPIAITEAHLGCTADEQVRWLWEIWEAAQCARRLGADVCAVTAWSLLGAYDWDSLVTKPQGRYEAGVFDVSGPTRSSTALACLVRALAAGRVPDMPELDQLGWWRGSCALTESGETASPGVAAEDSFVGSLVPAAV